MNLARPTQTYLMPHKLRILHLLFRNCLSSSLVTRPNYKFWFLLHRPPPLQLQPSLFRRALHPIVGQTTVVDGPITGLNSHGLYLPPKSGNTNQPLLHCLHDIQLSHSKSGKVATSSVVRFVVQPSTLIDSAVIYPPRQLILFLPPPPPPHTQAPHSTFTTPYAHIVVHYLTSCNSPNWVVDFGTFQYVTTDLASLALNV